jgi:hypothetical protein
LRVLREGLDWGCVVEMGKRQGRCNDRMHGGAVRAQGKATLRDDGCL